MAMDTYRCPRCRTVLRLPPQLEIARMSAAAGGSFIGFTTADTLPCGQCGHRIPIADIVNSAPKPKTWWQKTLDGIGEAVGCLIFFAVAIFLIVMLGKCSGG